MIKHCELSCKWCGVIRLTVEVFGLCSRLRNRGYCYQHACVRCVTDHSDSCVDLLLPVCSSTDRMRNGWVRLEPHTRWLSPSLAPLCRILHRSRTQWLRQGSIASWMLDNSLSLLGWLFAVFFDDCFDFCDAFVTVGGGAEAKDFSKIGSVVCP